MAEQVIESLEVFTPLGLRFFDAALQRSITNNLTVNAWPKNGPKKVTTAQRNRSDVYTFRWLPGMRPVEHRYRDEAFFDASIPQRRDFVVKVSDSTHRFQPVAFEVSLPLPDRGVFLDFDFGSPPQYLPRGIPLFSAPTRRSGERMLAVRATLLDTVNRRPASWALVRIDAPHGRIFRGIADGEGRVAVVFPYPGLEESFTGSPASLGNGRRLGERGWDIRISIFYQPSHLVNLHGTTVPEYRTVLNQRLATIWSVPANPSSLPVNELNDRLEFGQELVLRTAGLSELQIVPAPASP